MISRCFMGVFRTAESEDFFLITPAATSKKKKAN
jgi:hypothetical protein